jgi:hypothetical protein
MGILVVGMHRSGTSALASALEAMGLTAGPAEGLMAANRDNPAGYYEQQSVADFNDEVLAHLGGGWDSPPQLEKGWSTNPSMAPYVVRASKLVDSLFGGEHFVLKDPRITVLLPFWRRALLDRFSVAMIVRDPIEVAWSLLLRDGLPPLTGLALWSAYYRAALAGLDGLPVHVCSYEGLSRTPTQMVESITESLKCWGELPGEIDINSASGRVEPNLRRDTWPRNRSELIEVPDDVVALDKLLAEKFGRHHRFEGEALPAPWWGEPLLEERRGVWQLRRQVEQLVPLRQQLSEVERRLAEANQRIAETDQHVANIEQQLLGTNAALGQMTAERDAHLQEVLRTREELAVWRERWNGIERRVPTRIYRALQRRRIARSERRHSEGSVS